MPSVSSRRSKVSPKFAFGIILLAAAAWGMIFFQQFHKSTAQRHIDVGNEYARRGDGPGAVREWRIATEIEPNNAFAWQLLGQSYFEARLWRQAKDALLQAKRISPETAHVNSLLASSCRNLEEPDDALKYAREEIKHNPNDIPALEVCVAVQSQAKRSDAQEMMRCLHRLTELEPTNVEHYVALAQVLIGQNNTADVLPVLDRILQLTPNNAAMLALRGFSRFYVDGSPTGMTLAEDDLTHALSLRPNLYVSYLYLGKIYHRRGEWKRAAGFLEEAARLNPKKQDAFFDLAAVYARMNQQDKAAAALQRFHEIAGQKEWYTHLKKRCDLDPGNFDLNLQAGLMALQQEERAEARYYLNAAHRLRPNDTRTATALRQLQALIDRMSAVPSSLPASAGRTTSEIGAGGP